MDWVYEIIMAIIMFAVGWGGVFLFITILKKVDDYKEFKEQAEKDRRDLNFLREELDKGNSSNTSNDEILKLQKRIRELEKENIEIRRYTQSILDKYFEMHEAMLEDKPLAPKSNNDNHTENEGSRAILF